MKLEWTDAKHVKVNGQPFDVITKDEDDLLAYGGLVRIEGSAFELLNTAMNAFAAGQADYTDAYQRSRTLAIEHLKAKNAYHAKLVEVVNHFGPGLDGALGGKIGDVEEFVHSWIDHPDFQSNGVDTPKGE